MLPDPRAFADAMADTIRGHVQGAVGDLPLRVASLEQRIETIPAGERGEKGEPGPAGEVPDVAALVDAQFAALAEAITAKLA